MTRRQLGKAKIDKWRGEIPIGSLYTAGTAGQVFFKALKEKGEIVGTRCDSCAQVYVPARRFCERCFAELTAEITVTPEGIVRSFSYAYVDRDGKRLKEPVASVLVQLDGATTVMLHRLLDAREPSDISIGSRVKAVLKPKSRRTGSILDIEGFRPVK
jgi:uncharacterized OB-fold protein